MLVTKDEIIEIAFFNRKVQEYKITDNIIDLVEYTYIKGTIQNTKILKITMPFKKGDDTNRSKGRPKGKPNKNTQEIKDAFKHLIEDNLDNMTSWLANIAKENPAKAIDLVLRMSEFYLPKLARTEVTGADGDDLFKDLTFTFNTAEDKTETKEEEDGQIKEN